MFKWLKSLFMRPDGSGISTTKVASVATTAIGIATIWGYAPTPEITQTLGALGALATVFGLRKAQN